VNISFPCLSVAWLILVSPAAFAQSPTAPLILVENFETTAVGEIPQGYTKNGAVGVVEDVAHSGKKALRIEAAKNGARRITKQGAEIAALGGEHWGRLYFKVQLPVAMPIVPEGKKSGVIHSTLVSGKALSPHFNDPIEVRPLDTLQGTDGMLRFIYNVQPKTRPEFATGSKGRFRFTDEWTLAEWHVDHATQTYQFFVNGEEVSEIALHKGAGKFEGAEIPAAWESMSFGWNNYQIAEPGFVAWIDDIALSKQRIGPTPSAAVRK
jgi:hypothetical protein